MLAFELSEDDVANVLQQNAAQVANSGGRTFAQLAEEIFDNWDAGDIGRIEAAALTGDDLDDQTDAAYAEIRVILVEQGILKR